MSSPDRPWWRRWWLFVLAGLLALAGGGLAAWLIEFRAPGDVTNTDVEFIEPPATEEEEAEKPQVERKTGLFVWPFYGYDAARTHHLPTPKNQVRPPFRRLWSRGGSHLIEFQPVMARRKLFYVKNNGEAYAVRATTGRVLWRKRVGRLNASSPAYSEGRLYIATLSKRIICLRAEDGRIIWARNLPARAESSPLVLGNRVFFGSEDGRVYALGKNGGRTIWTYRAGGAVKAALAYSNGKLYFGDYNGEVTAIRASNGSRVWKAKSQGRSFNRSGNFYSSPAVAFGRVYVGNTDGRIYSFSSRSGELAWSRSLGGYVYASPAVAKAPGTRPSVYIGAYGGRFYALDARNGNVRWAYNSGGKISGAATVIGGTVYFSNLSRKTTSGLDVRNGRRVFKVGRGAFNPAISDGQRLYITGYSSQYAYEPEALRRQRVRKERIRRRKERAERIRERRERRRRERARDRDS
jgi:outer membrane protein assembly factor BamB